MRRSLASARLRRSYFSQRSEALRSVTESRFSGRGVAQSRLKQGEAEKNVAGAKLVGSFTSTLDIGNWLLDISPPMSLRGRRPKQSLLNLQSTIGNRQSAIG